MGGRKKQNKSGSGWTDAGAPALLPDSSVQIKMTGGSSGVEEKKKLSLVLVQDASHEWIT